MYAGDVEKSPILNSLLLLKVSIHLKLTIDYDGSLSTQSF